MCCEVKDGAALIVLGIEEGAQLKRKIALNTLKYPPSLPLPLPLPPYPLLPTPCGALRYDDAVALAVGNQLGDTGLFYAFLCTRNKVLSCPRRPRVELSFCILVHVSLQNDSLHVICGSLSIQLCAWLGGGVQYEFRRSHARI